MLLTFLYAIGLHTNTLPHSCCQTFCFRLLFFGGVGGLYGDVTRLRAAVDGAGTALLLLLSELLAHGLGRRAKTVLPKRLVNINNIRKIVLFLTAVRKLVRPKTQKPVVGFLFADGEFPLLHGDLAVVGHFLQMSRVLVLDFRIEDEAILLELVFGYDPTSVGILFVGADLKRGACILDQHVAIEDFKTDLIFLLFELELFWKINEFVAVELCPEFLFEEFQKLLLAFFFMILDRLIVEKFFF